MRALGLHRTRAFARSASTLVVAEHNNVTLSPSSLSAVTAATELKGDITVLVLGHEAHDVAQQVRSSVGAHGVGCCQRFNFIRGLMLNTRRFFVYSSRVALGDTNGVQAANVTGVTKVLHGDDPAYGKWVAENVSRAVAAVQVGAECG